MTKSYKQRLEACSKRAQKLYRRIEAGRIYPAYMDDNKIPKSMQELRDAELVEIRGRIFEMGLAFTPVKKFKQMKSEGWGTIEDD